MAEHKRNVSKKELSEQEAGQTEASPNPHNETNVVEMPIRTDQRQETQGENVIRARAQLKAFCIPQ